MPQATHRQGSKCRSPSAPATDNVNEVTVTDTSGKSVTISRSSVRTVFGLKSIRYTITPVGGSGNKTSLQVKASTHNVKGQRQNRISAGLLHYAKRHAVRQQLLQTARYCSIC